MTILNHSYKPMELTGNETWIAAGVGMIGMIVSFFFGKAGVFQKTVDFIFKSKETRAMKIEDEISAREARNSRTR